MVDPYLTNSLSLIDYTLDRQMKVNKKIFSVRPDVIVLTNCHPDHADVETISKFAKKQKNKLTILSCESVFCTIADYDHCALANNIMFQAGSEWSIEGFNIQAVEARTDDSSAIGVIITDTQDGKKYYVAGDTLYNKYVIQDLPNDIYAAFLPINGEYGSMNVLDAKRLALKIDARYVVPVHFGMFDKVDPSTLELENKIIPQPYKIIDFEASIDVPSKKLIDRKFNEKPYSAVANQANEQIAIPVDDLGAKEDDAFTDEVEADYSVEVDGAECSALVLENENNEVEVAEVAEGEAKAVSEIEVIEVTEDEAEAESEIEVVEITEGEAEPESEVEVVEVAEGEAEAESEVEVVEIAEGEAEAESEIEVVEVAESEIEVVEVAESEIEVVEVTEGEAEAESEIEYEEPLYDDFDDFDESDDDYQERKSKVFEPFTPEELMSYASDDGDDLANDVDENDNVLIQDDQDAEVPDSFELEELDESEYEESSTDASEDGADDLESENELIDEANTGNYEENSFNDFDDSPEYEPQNEADNSNDAIKENTKDDELNKENDFSDFDDDTEADANSTENEGTVDDEIDVGDVESSEDDGESSEDDGESNEDDGESNEDEQVEDDKEDSQNDAENEKEGTSSGYVSKPQNNDTDDADIIDAYVKELEKLDRGETPEFK